MRLTASDLYTYHRPSDCELRVYFRHRAESEAPLGPYEEVLLRLANRHERAHLSTFPTVVDVSAGDAEDRQRRSREAVEQRAPIVYHALLGAVATLDGVECEVVGEPDFLICESGQYVVRDSKISKRITEKDHPEILRQLELYGWLYEQAFRVPPLRLEVHRGPGDIVPVAYDGGRAALERLKEIARLKRAGSEPESPVGWTKCGGCGFHRRCWPRAERVRDVALVNGVDQGLARALYGLGVRSMDELLARLDEAGLAAVRRPWGRGTQRVGKRAGPILRNARALAFGEEIVLERPSLPDHPHYVMFDLEGLPPHLDELEKVYLWGMQVWGERPGPYQASTATFGADGDREGWEAFLALAGGVFEEYGDLPFAHWHHYERTRLEMYIERFGDREGIAACVRRNLLDLLPITQQALALPLPSYSLKVVERYVGFGRVRDEADGEWAMAKYIEATETEDVEQRAALVDEIRAYNQEDLAATWAVLTWLKKKAAPDGS